jgi:glucokinase
MISKSMTNLLLAGDVGGTKTLLGLFERAATRPRVLTVSYFGTLEHDGLSSIVDTFLRDCEIAAANVSAACFGAAGPVIDGTVHLTNVPWYVDARALTVKFGFKSIHLLNDLEAMAYAMPVLGGDELHVLQEGTAAPHGNIGIIAAGTGLGEALLHQVDGRQVASPSEGGHADFSARTEREMRLVRDLTDRYGRADVEHVISGRGLLNIHRVSHSAPCTGGVDLDDAASAPAAITSAALESRCAGCVEALDLFVEAYGAEAGNLALRSVATGGIFVGGGIAPKILPALSNGTFLSAFCAKAPLEDLLRSIPVKIVLNEEAGLIGAAVRANSF